MATAFAHAPLPQAPGQAAASPAGAPSDGSSGTTPGARPASLAVALPQGMTQRDPGSALTPMSVAGDGMSPLTGRSRSAASMGDSSSAPKRGRRQLSIAIPQQVRRPAPACRSADAAQSMGDGLLASNETLSSDLTSQTASLGGDLSSSMTIDALAAEAAAVGAGPSDRAGTMLPPPYPPLPRPSAGQQQAYSVRPPRRRRRRGCEWLTRGAGAQSAGAATIPTGRGRGGHAARAARAHADLAAGQLQHPLGHAVAARYGVWPPLCRCGGRADVKVL
jgi:hypothetical protein